MGARVVGRVGIQETGHRAVTAADLVADLILLDDGESFAMLERGAKRRGLSQPITCEPFARMPAKHRLA